MIIILRQVYIYKDDELLYYRHFGKALKREIFDNLIEELRRDAFAGGLTKVQYHDYYKYRISYTTEPELGLIFVFVTGLTDNFENIKKELIRCKKEFLNLFEDILHHRFDAKTFEIFDPTVDSIHRNLRPKISLVGFSGVGKTTITRLIKAEEIPMQHIPTITGDIATIKIGKLHFHLWDFAGQEQFSYLWNNFIKGSDAVLLITDSTLENVEKSKFFLELIKERAPHAHTAVIGNKQDLEGAMKPEQIEKILGLKTYSMVAKDPSNRDKMIQIIADVLEMSAEVSPLLKPLLERDKLTEEATKAIEDGDFEKAALLFEKISDLCIELGDDSLGREFYEKAQKIKNMLKKIGVESAETTQTPISEQEAPPPAPKQAPKVAAPKQPAPPPAPKQPAPPPAPKQAPKVAAPKQPAPPPAPKQPA
ncbi:MAG: ADP-ribosylation factor-like protein, partial [Promethearchaeota archaeon]